MSTQEEAVKNNSFEMILHSACRLPGIKINRASFLRKELSKYFDSDIAEKAIETTPAQAGITVSELEKVAKASINYETTKVTTLSAVTGVPGGFAMAAAIPADVTQFFGHVIRILQKLGYLYGWQDIFSSDSDGLDDKTSNELILFVGVMFGVNAANAALAKIANSVALKTEKALIQKALTKGAIYPIVKKTAKLIGVNMTKQIFARGVGKLIPVVGGVISGGITFAGFVPMAKRLQKYLSALPIANVEFYNAPNYCNIVEIDFSDIIAEK